MNAPWHCRVRPALAAGLCLAAVTAHAQEGHEHHHMTRDPGGFVMNANPDRLPRDCERLAGEHAFTVRAGTRYAADDPGMIFGMDVHEYRVEPCSRVTVTFINEDEVRHQWMVHGLPSYLYPGGMFHMEASGGGKQTGSFIVPSDDRTYLVHCDMAQHMEKGMKGQLVVGGGDGDLPSIPGISAPFESDRYLPRHAAAWLAGTALATLALAFAIRLAARRGS